MAIALRKPDEIAKLRKAGEIVGKTLQYLQENIKYDLLNEIRSSVYTQNDLYY